jgi:anti-anti-sigma regulatory factor
MAWATAAGLTLDTTEDLQLALGEALANAVEHAYTGGGAGECEYRVARAADGSLDVEVTDTGRWRPPPADRGFRGRGLELISVLARDVEIVHGADAPAGSGTRVRFRFPPDGGADSVVRTGRPAVSPPAGSGDGSARLVETRDADGARFAVEGDLDVATAGPIGADLLRRIAALDSGVPVVLDLRPTSYLASAGVGMVLRVRAGAEETGVPFRVLTAPGSPPERILELAGLTGSGSGLPTRSWDATDSAPVTGS